ncbi:MAG: signal transduction histidine kinase, nitrogen specific, NtrB [Acidobacteriales bacterium]|nr:signal transduction histidine kinase, nitrogen specific, NtrB [Terriglobales bacterium]
MSGRAQGEEVRDGVGVNRAENLVAMALELGNSLSLPDLVHTVATRAASMFGAQGVAVALAHGEVVETVALQDSRLPAARNLQSKLTSILTSFAEHSHEPVQSSTGAELLGELHSDLKWEKVTVARLTGTDGELLGLICLADAEPPITVDDLRLLQAFVRHASMSLENSRLFSRITQASKQWAEIFDSLTDFIVVHDDEHRVMRVNRTLAEFIGARPAELIGIHMRDLLAKGDSVGMQPCPFCLPDMKQDEFIHPVLERVYLLSTSRVHGALDEGLQTVHVLKDITDRREAERRYQELFDNVQEGVFFSSPEGRFIEVNNALVSMLGYASKQELLSIHIPTQLYVSPQHRLQGHEFLDPIGEVRHYDASFRKKDGTQIHALVNAFAVTDADGKVVQYRGMILDVTSTKNFQTQLQRERDFNIQILNNTQSMILVADTAGLISYANRRCYEAGGYGKRDLVGHKLAELVSIADRATWDSAFDVALLGDPVDNLEIQLIRGGGSTGTFSVNMSPMRGDHDVVNSVVVVMTDITEVANIQAKLMNTEKLAAVGQLVSGVAHEVNNPLTAIMGFADLMLENPKLPDAVHQDLRVIMQEAQRTKEIVQNLLSFARQMPPQREPVDVNAVLRRTIALRSYDFSSHGVDVVERLEEPLPHIIGDGHQLQQVFLNILNNAYDAVRETERRGRIEISTIRENDWVHVMFKDNGPGIANAERIFDPFFTTKDVGKGTGLGLSICYGIVHEHAGEITCENNPGSAGATFMVKIPMIPEPYRKPSRTRTHRRAR